MVYSETFFHCSFNRLGEFYNDVRSILYSFFYKYIFYKNIEAEICETLRIFKKKSEANILPECNFVC